MLGVGVVKKMFALSRGVNVTLWKRTASQAAGQRLDISGIYPPIATPFTEQEELDYHKLEENLQKYAKIPFKGSSYRPTENSADC